MKNISIFLSIAIFTIVALAHLYRILQPFPILIDSYAVPEWISYVGFIIPRFSRDISRAHATTIIYADSVFQIGLLV